MENVIVIQSFFYIQSQYEKHLDDILKIHEVIANQFNPLMT